MFLKEIIINGFKSFANRTRVLLGPGVTTIVGPNGCGKSNIVDAIRWVLGEQSAKALRGGKMHDVIFQGTDKRKPLHFCEVTLIFSDCEKELGTAFNEVEITRRVSRDGASDYFLNGKRCRLRDIQTLFMDTGVGRESYSFMMQGQIDRILSNNPAQRRMIFEEAAGITSYKVQRAEALRKLDTVDQNLSRATDVMDEVNRQMGSKKRQASKALRYKKFKHRLTHLELALYSVQYTQRQETIAALSGDSSTLSSQVEEAQTHLQEQEAALAAHKAQRAECYESLQTTQQKVFDYRSEKDQADNQAELAVIRSQDLGERLERIDEETATLKKNQEALLLRSQDDVALRQSQQEVVGSSDAVFKEKNDALSEAVSALSQEEGTLYKAKQDLVLLEGNGSRLRTKANNLEVELKAAQVKQESFEENAKALRQKEEELTQSLAEIVEKVSSCTDKQTETQATVKASQEALDSCRSEFRAAQEKVQDQDRQVARLGAQLNVLEGLQEKLEGFSEGAKAILQGKLKDLLPKDQVRVLTKSLEAEEAFTPHLKALLGSAIDAIALDEGMSVVPLSEALQEKRLGRACFQIEAPFTQAVKKPSKNVPEWLCPAFDKVTIKDDKLEPLFKNLLSGCFFCESLEEFLAFWSEQTDFEFLLVTTAQGEVVDRRGLVYGGALSSKSKQSSFLEREAEIRKLKASKKKEDALLEQLKAQAETLGQKLESSEESVEENRKALVAIGQELSSVQAQQRSLEQSQKSNQRAIEQAQKEFERLQKRHDEARETLDKALAEFQEIDGKVEAAREAVTQAEESVTAARQEREVRQEALSQVRVDLAEKKQRLELLERGLSELKNQSQAIEDRIGQLVQEKENIQKQRATLQEEQLQQKQKSEHLEAMLKESMASLESVRGTLANMEEVIKGVEEGLSQKRSEQHDRETALNQKEVRLAKERSQCEFLIEKAVNDHDMQLDQINWQQELWEANRPIDTRLRLQELEEDIPEDEQSAPEQDEVYPEPTEEDLETLAETDWKTVEEEVGTLRSRVHSMGAVNEDAIEEYTELKERHDFLKTQTDDLIASKEALLTAIEDINQTSRTLFQETFEKVRENFVYTFNILFGGGKADLSLSEGEDILDSGIDIIAQPPGTRLKTLSLLSGGQKTMTAVALLFAIYRVKPSPFCVLDELDAPLDDANIGRFTDMLKEFTNYSQFLVISHNKRTIAASDTIYGVTMQERGVTTLISMQFNAATGRTEAKASEEKAQVADIGPDIIEEPDTQKTLEAEEEEAVLA